MGGLMASVIAGLTSAALAIIGKLFTQAFFEAVLSRVTIQGLGALAKMSTNTVDDELVEDAAQRLGVEWKKTPS